MTVAKITRVIKSPEVSRIWRVCCTHAHSTFYSTVYCCCMFPFTPVVYWNAKLTVYCLCSPTFSASCIFRSSIFHAPSKRCFRL